MKVGKKDYRARLDDGNFFYLAGVWEPPIAGWPLPFEIITVYAGSEVSDHQERHSAVVLRRQVMQWLDGTAPASDILISPLARTFFVQEVQNKAARTAVIQRQLEF